MKSNYHVILGLIFIFSFLNGSKAQEDILTSIAHPSGIVIFDDDLYISLHVSLALGKFELDNMSNSAQIIKHNLEAPFGMGLHDHFLYVAEHWGNRIYKRDLHGVQADEFLFEEAITGPTDIEVTDEFYYLCLEGEDRVVRVNRNNPDAEFEELISGINGPTGICLAGDYLYVAENSINAIFKIDLTSPEFEAVRIDIEGGPNHLFATEDHLYFSLFFGNKIGRLDLQNTELPYETVLDVPGSPTGLFIQDNILYYADYYDQHGKIAKYNLALINSIEEEEEVRIELFPNPASDKLMIHNLNEDTEVALLNETGQMVLRTVAVPGEPLDISNLPKGMYYIHVNNRVALPFSKM